MRSALYVPGDRPEKLAGALTRGADALIADLEDAVAPGAKPTARRTVAAWLTTLPQDAPEIWIRINPGEAGHEDLRALEPVLPTVAGICVAKTETPADLATIDKLLGPAKAALCPVLESAAAVLGAQEIARAPRVVRLQLGEADLCADIGVDPGADERELLWPRSQIVLASAAAGIDPPLGPVSTDFRDLDRLAESTHALRRLGFQGRACIHPAQLPVVNEVFTPSPDELARARALVARFEAAGSGVVQDESGRMVDEAVIRRARRTLAQGKVTR
ncbi:CoA ester lyase [Actinomadura soli]|uniref:CoA ester lyase n=1 Tax=Actinomadura soli TaxID=2508997 RepID=A0A5C4J7Q3_9ACTN|nr:CoA ester lyase [Actinomadura soli]TMQ94803.1 CoA ester lyase [Actinomadura soli]